MGEKQVTNANQTNMSHYTVPYPGTVTMGGVVFHDVKLANQEEENSEDEIDESIKNQIFSMPKIDPNSMKNNEKSKPLVIFRKNKNNEKNLSTKNKSMDISPKSNRTSLPSTNNNPT